MNTNLLHRYRFLRAGSVGLTLACCLMTSIAEAAQRLANRSFEVAGGAGWTLAPGALTDPFAVLGEVNLHRSGLPLKLLWQELSIENAGGVAGTASVQLVKNTAPTGNTIAIYLDYLDGSGTSQRLLLLNPANDSVALPPTGTSFSTSFTVPAGAQRITGFSIDKSGAGNFSALEFSLDLQTPMVTLTTPAEGAAFAGGATIPLAAVVDTGGESISAVEFFASGTLIGQGQSGLAGQWSFPDGSFLGVMGTHGLDYMPASGGMYAMGGTFPTPLAFAGSFTTWPSGGGTATGNVSIAFSFASNGTLHAAIGGDAPLGSRILDGGTTSALVRDFTLSWQNVVAGTYALTARAYYGSTKSVTSLPVNITVGSQSATPQLVIRRVSATQMELSWPDDGGSWHLEQQAGLEPIQWLPLSGTPVLSGGRYALTVTMSGPTRFYRLTGP
ncbi:MAG: Ig-like domain-containing protein [Verrucomicrobia bacterium]|nr:Ig-like domain-containing protein [Verrucomicrobiota bacterium]